MTYNFLIEYKVFTFQRVMIKAGSMRCKNKATEDEARRSLNAHLMKSVPGAHQVVIIKCKNETEEERAADILALAEKMVRAKRAKGNDEYDKKDALRDIGDALKNKNDFWKQDPWRP